MRAEFPEKLSFLFDPIRYKVAYGGRGGAKSWAFARALLITGAQRPIRWLCARETMTSIRDSVHTLLRQQVGNLELQGRYDVGEAVIRGKNGTEFFFAGLKHNVANIKSLEGADGVWVEEAQTVSKDSWETLIPTVRKDDSEIWVSFNPMLETDDTYRRFVLNPPPNAKVVKIGWQDNPWFPEVLRIEMEHLKATDPAAYAHIWEGECRSAVEGAIFGAEMQQAHAEGRITSVPCDRTRAVDTFWDLGFGDKTAIWFAQAVDGWYNIIDYLEDAGKPIHHYIVQLQQKGYVYGTDWLPHDGIDAIIHTNLSQDRTRSIEQLMRAAGRQVRIAPKLHITDRINAARTVLPQCRFDSQKCADGLQGLRHYQWGEPTSSGVERTKPLHDWASHPSDAFCTLAVGIRQPKLAPPAPPRQEMPIGGNSWMS